MKCHKVLMMILVFSIAAASPALAELDMQVGVEGNNVDISWNKVEGTTDYIVLWDQEKGPRLRRGGSSGLLGPETTSYHQAIDGGEVTNITVYAIKNGLTERVTSKVKAILPEGKVLGTGKVTLLWTANYRTDNQKTTGSVYFKIYQSSPNKDYTPEYTQPAGDVVFHRQLFGQGKISWDMVSTIPDCYIQSAANGRLFARGQLRTAPDCKLDIEFHEVWAMSINTGTCGGYPVDPYGFVSSYTTIVDNVPLVEGHKEALSYGVGGDGAFTFTNLEIETETGCVVGGK